MEEARQLLIKYAISLTIDLGYQDFDAELDAFPGKYAPPEGALILALVTRIIEEARTRRSRLMRLDTLSRMEDALQLYAAFDFVPTAPYIHNPIEDARYLELQLA